MHVNEIQGQDDVAAPPAPPDLFAAFEALVSLVADPQRHAAEVETSSGGSPQRPRRAPVQPPIARDLIGMKRQPATGMRGNMTS